MHWDVTWRDVAVSGVSLLVGLRMGIEIAGKVMAKTMVQLGVIAKD